MLIDYSKLIGRIVEKFGSRTAFAKAIGWNLEVLSRRLNNKARWNPEDYIRTCEILDIDPEEIYAYFFTPKLR
jgi:hypothetical protein